MAGIFISYRRADSDGWAGRLRDALRARFGDLVFQDVDNIADGEVFSEVIDRALQSCSVALVVIGPSWATAHDEHGRRLDHEEDWVRTETAMVLNRKIRVIPVLVGGARLPRAEDLPEELRSLTKRQAREIRSNSWDSDVALLAKQLEQIVGPPRKRPMWVYALPVLAVLGAIGAFVASRDTGRPAPGHAPAESTAAAPALPAPPPEAARAAPADPPQATADVSKQKEVETEHAPQAGQPAAPAKTAPDSQVERIPPPPAQPKSRRPAPPVEPPAQAGESGQPRLAKPAPRTERPLAAGDVAAPARATPRRPAAPEPEPDAPSERAAKPAAPAPAATAATPPASDTLDLPGRPAAARALKVGDSWTYRLREVRFNRNLATVTHEISGGGADGISEMVSSDGAARGGTERRLALRPRIFEQPLSGGTTLFEFAPFLAAFSELQPGATWSRIPGAVSSDSINSWRFTGKVVGRERVAVPAGNFVAIKAELEGQLDLSSPSTFNVSQEIVPAYQTYTIWFVPDVGRAVKYVRRTFNRARLLLDHEQYELVSYQLK